LTNFRQHISWIGTKTLSELLQTTFTGTISHNPRRNE
jgi:hypothetical protein